MHPNVVGIREGTRMVLRTPGIATLGAGKDNQQNVFTIPENWW